VSLFLVYLRVVSFLERSATRQASPVAVPNVRILWSEFMAALAMRFAPVARTVQFLLGQDLFERISAFVPNGNRSHIYAVLLGKFSDMVGHAFNFNHALPTTISSLFAGSSPSAIRRFVIPVRVNAVKAHLERSRPHVLKKRLEGMTPSGADLYSSAAVVGVSDGIRIVATLLHSAKTYVCGLFLFVSHGMAPVGRVIITQPVAGYNK